jgi:hypothetical protein
MAWPVDVVHVHAGDWTDVRIRTVRGRWHRLVRLWLFRVEDQIQRVGWQRARVERRSVPFVEDDDNNRV